MIKWLKINFRTIWWVAMLLFFSLMAMGIWGPALEQDFRHMEGNAIILLLIWVALLLWPLYKEINLFGFSLKKEIDSLKSEIREQRLEFREQIVNLRSEINIKSFTSQQVNVNLNIPPYTAESPEIIPTGDWTRLIKPSDEALKVLATIWKHQQQYHPGIWRFTVGPRSPNYPIYDKGVTETTRLGLTAYWPGDGMVFLTPSGVEYCRANENKLPKDWDYHRWQKLGAAA